MLMLVGCGGGDGSGRPGPSDAHPTGTTGPSHETAESDGTISITLAAGGDVLAHTAVNKTAAGNAGGEGRYDYGPMFADVAPVVSAADLSLCHLETPLSPDDSDLSAPGVLSFNSPHELADAVGGAGFDGCDFASNHTMDRGLTGLAATEQVVRDAGLGYAGPTATKTRAGAAEVYRLRREAGQVTVAHLAYTYTYPNSGTPTTTIPSEAPWLAKASWPSIGSAGILEQAERAKADGADFVVVSMHWGQEYQARPTAQQRRIARELLRSDAVDLVLGTHAHVIQPCERINDKHVAYGLGNLLSNQSPDTATGLLPATQEGMVATFTLTKDAQGRVTTAMRYQPTRVEIRPGDRPGPHVIRLVSPSSHPETWARTTATVQSLGGCGATADHP